MFRAIQVISIQQFISCIFSVSYHLFQSWISSDKLTEIIVCFAISFLAEFYRTFDNSHFIFIFNSLLVHYL